MARYGFLDTWALTRYTEADRYGRLSAWVEAEQLTVVVNSLSFVELFNPRGTSGDRVERVARFLASHKCCIVDSVRVFRREITLFPSQLAELPVELELSSVPAEHRAKALELFMRGDSLYLDQGKDIREWAANYAALKNAWPASVALILDKACESALLRRDSRGRFDVAACKKEEFLCALDIRHLASLSPEEQKTPMPGIFDLALNGATAQLPAVRTSSLAFWYAYVEADRAFPMRRSGSDLGDFFQMSLMPYCTVFTADRNMFRLIQRLLLESPRTCAVLDPSQLAALLAGS